MMHTYVTLESQPIFGGIFFRSSVLIQALLIPLFFGLRSLYDSISNSFLLSQYGCDNQSSLSVRGVAMHEVCLCVMLTGTVVCSSKQ